MLNHSRFPDGRAHGFAAPLRVAVGLRPKCPQGTRFPSRLPGFGADSRSLNRRGGRWPRPPLVSLPTFGSLWPLRAQVPTGHTLPSGAPNPCAAAQNASVASGPRPQETRLSAPPTIPRTTSRHPYTLGYIPTPQALRAAQGRKKRVSPHPLPSPAPPHAILYPRLYLHPHKKGGAFPPLPSFHLQRAAFLAP